MDLIFEMLVKMYKRINVLLRRIRSFLYVLDLRLKGGDVPWSVRIAGRVTASSAKNLIFAGDATIGAHVMLNISKGSVVIGKGALVGAYSRIDAINGKIRIGSHASINNHCIITAWSGVDIGENSIIAPFCHITDRNHGIDKSELIRLQFGATAPILIGRDVWIASSCIILLGVKIGDGAVIGANSLVNKDIEPYTIAAGSPTRNISKRVKALNISAPGKKDS